MTESIYFNDEQSYNLITSIAHQLVDNNIDGSEYLMELELLRQEMADDKFEEFTRLISREAIEYAKKLTSE